MQNKLSISLLLFSFIFLCSSCEDVVDLTLPDGETQLVIDGWLTNQEGEKQVILSNTTNYFNNVLSSFETNALVVLNNEDGPIDTLAEKSNGLYITDYVGQIGTSYHLYIRTNSGEEYASIPEQLQAVSNITKIYSKFVKASTFEEEGYYVFIETDEPVGVGNFYQWKQYVNGVYLNTPSDLLFFSDEFTDGNPIREFKVTVNDPLELGDTYLIQQLSISENAYEFFNQLQIQTAFVGTLFDNPPAALKGNIINLNPSGKKPLGYFGVSAVSDKRLIIE